MRIAGGRFEVRRSRPGTGLGLFAREGVSEGEFVAEYAGEKIPTKEANLSKSRYLFEIDDAWTIDAESDGGPARYINHCCKPNAEARNEEGRIVIYAIRRIRPREEITVDYGEEYFDEFIWPRGCRCGAKIHRR